jgi:hypothetical protein
VGAEKSEGGSIIRMLWGRQSMVGKYTCIVVGSAADVFNKSVASAAVAYNLLLGSSSGVLGCWSPTSQHVVGVDMESLA